ncbi:5'-3' exoribonuclease 1 [Anabrus simplex]|uniref:5'-3' exoribonuclease 1 n=1 Tax=Anabrus simplex TaxID=316456 RepID=UPI0035A3C55B
MGVPKFFRWISERYPCLSEVVREYQIPEFDNLYLDMNGIIHTCSHPNDFDPHFRISEEKIFKDIFHYIEILFRIIQPRKLFFMAVDGVAPRAKMNQQRGRRFRSAKDAEDLEKRAREKGEKLPTEERFDSNCITPGTVFMARLHEQLKYFVTYKISTDTLWQGVKIILSGHNTPGEGEHKIMDYIRYMKSQPDYDPNTRHCLYGLDADLIMLGLCTHEPHFSLLREEVKFGRKRKQQRASAPEETTFFLLHLSLMREYLELEFSAVKSKLPFPFDLEKIIDDWVLMGFLVGNDFIPPLPDMHIINGALPILYQAYMEVLPTLGGYINEGGTLNLPRFQKYMEKLAAFDIAQFRDVYADLKYLEGKRGGRRFKSKERPTFKNKDSTETNGEVEEPMDGEDPAVNNPELAALIKATNDIFLDVPSSGDDDYEDDDDVVDLGEEDCFDFDDIDRDPDESDEANAMFLTEFSHHKRHYYKSKLEYSKVTPEVLRSQAECYVRAIQWNLNYYYSGVCSWSWFYPHHYAPYISDVRKFSDLKLEFDLGEPFLPFQQLLAVLPALSKKLLPEPYQTLMVDEDSPIIKYYPSTFRTDLNGKKQEWEAVVLIPFIDEKLLLEAMRHGDETLSEDERERNKHGPMLIFSYTEEDLGPYKCPEYFPSLQSHHAVAKAVTREEIYVEPSKLVRGLCPGVKLDVYFPGFPTLKHIPHTASLEKKKVKVFEEPSRGDNMILRIVNQDKPDLKEIAQQLLGKTIFVDWPHLLEAKVLAVSSKELRYTSVESDSTPNFVVEELKGNSAGLFDTFRNSIRERYMNRLGVDIGSTHLLITAATLVGRKYVFGKNGKITLEKQWNSQTNTYVLQATVKDITTHDSSFVQFKMLSDVFPPKSICFLLAHPHYGSMGEVMESNKGYARSGRVKVNMTVTMEPPVEEIQEKYKEMQVKYMPGSVAAQRLGISPHLLSRVTGTIYIIHGRKEDATENSSKTNVGLNLKFNKKNEEIPGYTRKEGGVWYYSSKAVDLVQDYIKKFPELFDYLNYHTGNDVFYESDIFPDKPEEDNIAAITSWMKEQPYYSVERNACGAEILEPEVVQEIENIVDNFYKTNCRVKTVTMQVKPYLLYKSSLQVGSLSPDPTTTNRLFDRVVNVRQSYTVPLGLKGTIIGIHKAQKQEDYLYDIVFDKPFAGGLALNCSNSRGYRVARSAFVNLSHGQRIEMIKTVNKPNTIVQPPGKPLQQDTSPYRSHPGYKMEQKPQPPHSQADHNSAFASWNNRGGLYSAPFFNLPNSQLPPFPGNINHRQQQQQQQQPFPVMFINSHQPTPPQPPKQSSPTEFQALWKELQKAANVDPSNSSPVFRKTTKVVSSPLQPPAQAPVVPRQEVSDTSTELLKKMLRIPDEPSQPSPQVRNMCQMSVQDIFEQARAAEKNAPQDGYARLLLHTFQSKGLGIPRYTYIQNPDDNMWVAQLLCQDQQMLRGSSAADKGQAAENVAKLALAQLGVPVHSPTPRSSNEGMKPITNSLPTPPQQWYQRNWSNRNQPHQQFRQPQQNPELLTSWRHSSDNSGRSYNQHIGVRPQQQPYIPPFGGQHQQNWSPQHTQQQSNWRQEGRAVVAQQSFVPLQAVKQQHRSRTASRQNEPQQPPPPPPPPPQQPQQEVSGVTNRSVTELSQSTDSSKDQPATAPSESANTKPIVTRQRKCRIAANFGNFNPPKSQ